jgi:hypothetical protein
MADQSQYTGNYKSASNKDETDTPRWIKKAAETTTEEKRIQPWKEDELTNVTSDATYDVGEDLITKGRMRSSSGTLAA